MTTGTAGLPTAFTAEAGSGPLVLAICAEYDALPDVGHACGHNIIAASAVGAGLGLLAARRRPRPDHPGPRDPGRGGRRRQGGHARPGRLRRRPRRHDGPPLARPSAWRRPAWPSPTSTSTSPARTAHASAAPWQGVNAGDAMVIAQVALGLLRQQLPPGDQVHGVVTKGGEAANIIPARVTGRFMARSLHPRTGSDSSSRGCGPASRPGPWPPGPRSHSPLWHRTTPTWRATATSSTATGPTPRPSAAGSPSTTREPPRPTLSTDMANVSLAVPTIHPLHGHRRRRVRQPPARVRRRLHHRRRPMPRSATVHSPWRGRPSTPPPPDRCATDSWPAAHLTGPGEVVPGLAARLSDRLDSPVRTERLVIAVAPGPTSRPPYHRAPIGDPDVVRYLYGELLGPGGRTRSSWAASRAVIDRTRPAGSTWPSNSVRTAEVVGDVGFGMGQRRPPPGRGRLHVPARAPRPRLCHRGGRRHGRPGLHRPRRPPGDRTPRRPQHRVRPGARASRHAS